jgi:uncharacterized protein
MFYPNIPFIDLGVSYFLLLGIGRAVFINYLLLLYIPVWFGVTHITGLQVSSISMFQVLFASLAVSIAFQ